LGQLGSSALAVPPPAPTAMVAAAAIVIALAAILERIEVMVILVFGCRELQKTDCCMRLLVSNR
jgi:hypothetical protein